MKLPIATKKAEAIVSKTVPVPALRHVIRIAAGSVPVPVEVVAGDVLVHAPAAVQAAEDVPVAVQEAAAAAAAVTENKDV